MKTIAEEMRETLDLLERAKHTEWEELADITGNRLWDSVPAEIQAKLKRNFPAVEDMTGVLFPDPDKARTALDGSEPGLVLSYEGDGNLAELSYTWRFAGNTVDFHRIETGPDMKSLGFFPRLMRQTISVFRKLGVARFEMTAEDDGSYMWAKLGFIPYDIMDIKHGMEDNGFVFDGNYPASDIRNLLDEDDPKSLHAIAAHPQAKEALHDIFWKGYLDMDALDSRRPGMKTVAEEMRETLDLLEQTAVQYHARTYLDQFGTHRKQDFTASRDELEAMIAGEEFANNRLAALAGEYIGGGLARDVYEHRSDSGLVVKFGPSPQTETENDLWELVKNTELEKWFAPVVDYEYPYLVQAKTEMLSGAGNFPDRLPNIFKNLDPWLENFSEYQGRIVCHDYGWSGGKPVYEVVNDPEASELVEVTGVDDVVRLGPTAREKAEQDKHREYMQQRRERLGREESMD